MRRNENLRRYVEFVAAARVLGYERFLKSARPTVEQQAPDVDRRITRAAARLERNGITRPLRERVRAWVFTKRVETLPEVIADWESQLTLRGRRRR